MDDKPQDDFKEWQDIVKILAEDIRVTRQLTNAIREQTEVAAKNAEAAMKRADAAWELVVITRNQINRPWYKKLLGVQ